MLTVRRAQGEWIPCEAGRTGADRVVIFGGTLRPQSAGVRARIRAFLVYACQMRRALSIYDAFRSARWWNAPVFR